MLDTRIWSDSWFRKINALDRYLFIYLLTNDKCSFCGIYELPISIIAFETGIDERDLEKVMLPRLSPKIHYFDGWVCITNFKKYHVTENSHLSKKGYDNALMAVPSHILEYFITINKPLQAPSRPSDSFTITSTITSTTSSSSKSDKKEQKDMIPFETFWDMYPKKVERKKSEEKWFKLTSEEQHAIISDIPKRKLGRQWTHGFIPNPMTYLNGERWTDEITQLSESKDITQTITKLL